MHGISCSCENPGYDFVVLSSLSHLHGFDLNWESARWYFIIVGISYNQYETDQVWLEIIDKR